MNSIERKLYKIVNSINEDDVVKNKKTGNVYTVKNFNPELHDKPTPDEVSTTKQKHGGTLPSEKDQKPTSQKPTPKQKTTGQKPSGIDFKSSAEKSKSDTADVDDTKLKSLIPGIDTSKKGLDDVSNIERQQISTIIDKLVDL
jgi:hypothetical protein